MTHSPGPWQWDMTAPSDLLLDAHGTCIVIGEVGFHVGMPDARLISAAPQLLALLREMTEDFAAMHDAEWSHLGPAADDPQIEAARALIARIEGAG